MDNLNLGKVVCGVYPKYKKYLPESTYLRFSFELVRYLKIPEKDIAKMMGVEHFEWITTSSFRVKQNSVNVMSFVSKRYTLQYLNDCLLKHLHIDQDMIDFVLKL